MTVRRNALGRGLEALLPSPAPHLEPAPAADRPVAHELPIERIRPNPDQPRRQFDEAELERLADSIRRHGVLQPVVVRHGADGEYELVVGERRWRAAQRAGRATLPVVVADVEPRERLELALVENVQRQDLNPIELAHAFRTLAEGGATQEEVGGRLGIDRSTVANHLRLLELARSLQEDVERGRLSVGHAKALLQVANPERRLHLRDAVVREGLSVRETERRARSATPGPPRSRQDGGATGLDPDTKALVDRLRSRLQTQVRIVGSGKRGRIEIEYFSGEDLERLVSMLEAGA